MELKEGLFAFAVIAGVVTIAVVGIHRWKDEAYRLRNAIEVHELSAAHQKRETLAARKEAEAAKAETAMCRRAIDHADKSRANLEAALKRAREKGE